MSLFHLRFPALLCALIALFTACQPAALDEPPAPPSPETHDPCNSAWKFSLALEIDDNEDLTWHGYASECFNEACETSWEPALGIICVRCSFPLCQNGFQWRDNRYGCDIPNPYTWTVTKEHNYWQGCITFEPDECLAESIPNFYDLTIYGYGCPF